jgi:formylglycine-generating enzyme required for sulfatase activity
LFVVCILAKILVFSKLELLGNSKSNLKKYAWYDDNSNDKTHQVGTKKPNPWGVYDMHGNVYEWC